MAEKKNRLLVIDGHAMAYRAHFALVNQNLTNADGLPTEAIFGFFRMLVKLLQEKNPTHLLLVFDPPRPAFRFRLYEAYKANRKSMPDSLRLQLDEIQEIIRSLQLPLHIPEDVEADDIMASVAQSYQNQNLETVLVSGDKDLFNVLFPNVLMLRARKGVSDFQEITADTVQAELGISREQVPDFMALTGDSSDNIPGVAGVGDKTASKLIQEYHSLENIYQKLEQIKPASLQKKLADSRENAFLSLELVTLKKDLPLPFDLDSLLLANHLPALAENIVVFRDKGFASLHQEFANLLKKLQAAGTAPETLSPAEEPAPQIVIHYSLIDTEEKLFSLAQKLETVAELAVDTETNSLSAVSADLVGISLAWKENQQYQSVYIPAVFDRLNEPHFDYQNLPAAELVIETLRPLLENPAIAKVGQNIKYDMLVLENHGIRLNNGFDTMVASFMLNPNQRRHNLDDLAEDLLGYKTVSYKELAGSGKKQKALISLPLNELAFYAAEDAEITLRLKDLLLPRLEKNELLPLYQQIDAPLVEVLKTMEKNGILIDSRFLHQLGLDYRQKLAQIEEQIYEQAGEKFNINSTRELQTILFEKLAIKPVKKTDKGQLSTDASVLEAIRHEHPLVPLLLEYRTISKLLSTYIEALPLYIEKKSGRIHSSFSQVTAATGRLASSDPNLQNIPAKDEIGRNIRRAFVAPAGSSLLSLDYSQIELRIMAHYSQDKNLLQAYLENDDIHDRAAYLLFRSQFDPASGQWQEHLGELAITSDYTIDAGILQQMKQTAGFAARRSQAKILNFSIVYGVTDFGLSQSMGISRKEARMLIDAYFISFPGVKKLIEDLIEKSRQCGYAENFFGRRRKIPEINTANRFAREAAERTAVNTPIQSTAADIIKLAMIEIQASLEKLKLKSRLLLQIHDELVFEVVNEEKEQLLALAREKMENVVKFSVPLKVSGGFGPNWEETK